MSNDVDAKDRILRASTKLFSEKGYDATSVTEIAQSADVTKALIYYYFKGKADILDALVQELHHRMKSITLDFVHANIVKMIEAGRLDITPDRLCFTNEDDISFFLKNGYRYFEEVLDFTLENRTTIRILMFESLKNSKNRNELFHFMSLTAEDDENPIIKTISQADKDFDYSSDLAMFEFFYAIFPLVNFAVYYDDYKMTTGQSDEELRASFLQTFKIMSSSLISGKDIYLRIKPLETEI